MNDVIWFYHNIPAFSPLPGVCSSDMAFEIAKKEFLSRYTHNDLFCLANHYWEFFFDWTEHITQKHMLDALNRFLSYVNNFNIWKCSFNEVSEWLVACNNILVRRINKDKIFIKTTSPMRKLSFRSSGVCEVRGLKDEPLNSREGIWTIENVPPNCLFEVNNVQ
jgi:hypothetical protein